MKKVKVKAQEILDFVKEDQDCKLEIYKDGDYAVLSAEAKGYENILTQEFSAYDFEDLGSDEEAYKDWLKSCYFDQEFQCEDEQTIEIEIQ